MMLFIQHCTPLEIDLLAVIKADVDLYSWFGLGLSTSGDTVVAGDRNDDQFGSNSGAVYVFVRNDTSWTQQAYLKASNPGVADYFGYSVSISGDTIVVGAYLEDSNATGVNGTQDNGATASGAAYVFVRIGTTWTQQAYLKASNTEAGDNFGYSVSISGDTSSGCLCYWSEWNSGQWCT
jgi:hypothetical protein